jgi:hypothetical protein
MLVRLSFITLHLRRRNFDALFLINTFKGKISAYLFWVLSVYACPLAQSEATLLLLFIVISRSVSQPVVFLLPMQSVGALTSLIKITFFLLTLVSFFNQNNFSLFLYLIFVLIVLLCFYFDVYL